MFTEYFLENYNIFCYMRLPLLLIAMNAPAHFVCSHDVSRLCFKSIHLGSFNISSGSTMAKLYELYGTTLNTFERANRHLSFNSQ